MSLAFIFDMDGVIIDSEPIHFEVDIQTMQHFGMSISHEQLERFVGMTNPEMWTILKQEYDMPQSVEEIIEYQLSSKIDILRTSELIPIDGITELLQQLKSRDIPIGLASSSPRRFIMEVLSKFQIEHYFQCIVSGEEVDKGKPAPDVYYEAAKLLGVSPESCFVIEDSRNGIKAAKAAGMQCIGYVNHNSGNQDLSAADRIVTSIREIELDEIEKSRI
ncbi:HAD family hydrolase [Cohnella mopanensis]|uniref:HAD family hydrolase n=1 Tax=Cohnella mopanensis TaxID=2911966 RepID=UPI001EF94353|nr:HAD family phosphatase [Cohnella mopanensis]